MKVLVNMVIFSDKPFWTFYKLKYVLIILLQMEVLFSLCGLTLIGLPGAFFVPGMIL